MYLAGLVVLYTALIRLSLSADGAASFPIFGGSALSRDSVLISNT